MKFGEQLKQSLIKDHTYHYINYDDLKRDLGLRLARNDESWTSGDENEFVTKLESELDKVWNFQKLKSNEVNRRIKAAEREVRQSVAASEANPNDVEEAVFDDLEDELHSIIADVHDLSKFTQLNYTGFQKIIKKHDKLTGWHLRPIFSAHMNSKPFFKQNFDNLIVKLSTLYDLVRTRGHPFVGDSSAGGQQQNFVRQTTKYWVHPDNITELKLHILKHLPVLVFNANKEFEPEDNAITSIYYDNTHLDLYRGRLEKTEGAEAIRVRWYGGMSTDTVFVERKTHREDWTGEKSVKARFPLKEKYVNDWMSGRMTSKQVFAKARREGKKSKKELDALEALATEIQYRVIHDRLRPVTRSFYNRTAFQLPGDARVRISLDTELTMVREDDFDGLDRAHRNWRRMDIGVDYPFSQLSPQDAERFPYAVLEVKLQTQMGQEPPLWIRDLVASHLVEAVPKFSKFIHGTATLLPDKVNLIPFWLPQMGVDIRKPPASQIGYGSNDTNGKALPSNGGQGPVQDEESAIGSVRFAASGNTQTAASDANASESTGLLSGSNNERSYDSNSLINYVWELKKRAYDILGYDVSVAKDPEGTEYVENIKVPPGKTMSVPVRIEPKVYFANERTFLSWIEIGILLGAMASGLLNFGSPIAVKASLGFFFVAVGTISYSIYIYILRVLALRNRWSTCYTDSYGPIVICFALAAAMGTNFVFQFINN